MTHKALVNEELRTIMMYVYPGDDVYIVAQQATQVYYLSYPCQTDNRLKGWDVVYKVSPHGKLPVPNNEDYNIDPNTYDGKFF